MASRKSNNPAKNTVEKDVFSYVTLIPNLPGYEGISTEGPPPAQPGEIAPDTLQEHTQRLELVKLGVEKGRQELLDQAEAIRLAGGGTQSAPAGQTPESERPGKGEPKEQEAETGNVLRLVGEVWHICYADSEKADFPNRADSVLHHLARLLNEPNRRFRSLEFYPPLAGAAPLPHLGRDESSDDRARKDYQARLKELEQEIKEADDAHDTETAAKLRKEFDELTEHFQTEMAPRKRGHKKRCGTPSPEEKADQSLRVALDRIKKRFRANKLEKLADHLDNYLDNGGGQWWYAPPPDTTPWHITRPKPSPEK